MGFPTELYYLRDLEKREVDFLVVWEDKPWFLVECKLKPRGKQTALNYFAQKLGVEKKFLVTLSEEEHYIDKKTGIHVIPANRFLMALT